MKAVDLLRSWDTHCHVFDPATHPYVPDAPYLPPTRLVSDLVSAVPTENFVIVMAVPDGVTPGAMLDGMKAIQKLGRQARGTVVMDSGDMTRERLRELDDVGVRSVRLHQRRIGEAAGALETAIAATATMIKQAGVNWTVDAQLSLQTWVRLIPLISSIQESTGVRCVADHMLCCTPDDKDSADLTSILTLVESGSLIVKISGLDRYKGSAELTALDPLVRRFLRCRNGDGVIFGSDWPHVVMGPGSLVSEVDTRAHLRFLREICRDESPGSWRKLMVDNPAALYR